MVYFYTFCIKFTSECVCKYIYKLGSATADREGLAWTADPLVAMGYPHMAGSRRTEILITLKLITTNLIFNQHLCIQAL